MDGQRTMLGDEDVSEAVRSLEVTAVTRYAADNPRVRQRLVQLQRAIAGTDDIVTEGRDQGTVVFPDAACKIFLTASAEERARRRWNDLRARDETVSLEDILAAQRRRDHEDASRAVGPLLPAADAVKVVTDGLSEDAVVNLLESLARGKYGKIT
jgi:cytidylate kinase